MVDRQEMTLDTWEDDGGFITPIFVSQPPARSYDALRLELLEALESTARNHLRRLPSYERAAVTSTPYISVPLGNLMGPKVEIHPYKGFGSFVGGDPS